MIYDFVIVGASIAGLYAGMKLAKNERKVCIIDRKKIIGIPVRCAEATGNRYELSRFLDIDESWIACDIKGLAVHFNMEAPLVKSIKDTGLILHRDRFEKALAQKTTEYGADILLEKNVSRLIWNHTTCKGVMCDNGEMVLGNVIIGADGCESKIGQWAGLTRYIPLKDAFSCVQYRVTSGFCNDNYLHFFIGSDIISKGYIWIFPKSSKEISVGAGLYGSTKGAPKAKELLDIFIEKNIPSAVCKNFVTGCVPLAICSRKLAKGNVVVIGDAARQANPLSTGGIMNTLEAADLAVESLLKIKSINDPQHFLTEYSQKWSNTQRNQQKIFYIFKEIYLECNDREILEILKKASALYKHDIDRTGPFKFHFFTLMRLFLIVFTKALKYWKNFFR